MALLLSTDKLTVKRLLTASGLHTPAFFLYEGAEVPRPAGLTFPLILKPRFQDASIGIEQESVVENSADLLPRLKDLHARYGAMLVEEYVVGREFNVSVFGYPKAQVMPLAEIDFSGFPADLHRIVSYRAKWDEESFEYHHTQRIFPDNLPEPLQQTMRHMAQECFALFGLRDYARIDLRLDQQARLTILEINANPCLSPDAGFPAAVAKSGMSYAEMIGGIPPAGRPAGHPMITIRPIVAEDRAQLLRLVERQDNFNSQEVEVAIEVIDDTLDPAKNDYSILVALGEGLGVVGFICYGEIPMTDRRFDLYWIAVDPDLGRQGVGKLLLARMEEELAGQGGGIVYVDTSSTPGYKQGPLVL